MGNGRVATAHGLYSSSTAPGGGHSAQAANCHIRAASVKKSWMSGDPHPAAGYSVAPDGTFHAPLVLSYPYKRTVGATMSRFLTGLRDRRIEGTVGEDGTVYMPPAEYDPTTGVALGTWKEVASTGTVLSWSWQPTVQPASALPHPFAWALIQLDGADTPMLHVVDVASSEQISTGARVKARWSDSPSASVRDIIAFDLVESGAAQTWS